MGASGAYYGLGAEPKALRYIHVLSIIVVFAALVWTGVALCRGMLKGRPSVAGEGSGEGSGAGANAGADTGVAVPANAGSATAASRLDDMLFFAALASPVAFVILAASPDPTYARYLTAGVIFGTIISARVVGRVMERVEWRTIGRIMAAVGLAATCCYAAGVAINLDQPTPVTSAAALATWLEAHNLHNGVGAYWSASIVTVESSGKVDVRPVVSANGRTLVRWDRNSASYWYQSPFNFVVFDLQAPWGGVSWQAAVNTFGLPARAYTVAGTYRVMVWNTPFHVSPMRGASR